MRSSRWLLATQVSACLAVTASAALWVQHADPRGSAFCGPGSGCETVRHSPLTGFFDGFVPLPLIGLVAFLVVLALSCRVGAAEVPDANAGGPRRPWRRPELKLFAVAGVGGVLSLPLLAYQAFSVGRFCWLCVLVDLSALFAAGSAFALARAALGGAPQARSVLRPRAWLAIGALLAALPIGWHAVRPEPPAPSGLQRLFEPDRINVIEFADFQCPYCRRLHPVLKGVVEEYGDRVHFRRLHRPLPMHPMAELAARAAICAEAAGQGEPMADRLFSIELDPKTIRRAARDLGLDLDQLDECMTSSATERVLAEHEALLPDERLEGLPTTFVQSEAIVGNATAARLRDAIDRAEHAEPAGAGAPVFVGLWAALFALAIYFGRPPRAGTSAGSASRTLAG